MSIGDIERQADAHGHASDGKPQGWGRGIVADFKGTVGTYWKKEMTNINGKTIACSFFLYFACIAPAVTFGAIYGKATKNNMGAVEMLFSTSWCGIAYALLGGQPMAILGGTGPQLALVGIVFKIAESMDVPFLTLYAWIGVWVCVYMFLAAFTDLNKIIRLCTRFTDELFSFLISLIFIINAIGSPTSDVGVAHYFNPNHKSHAKHADNESYNYMSTALLSLIIFVGTFQLSFFLRKFKFSSFLPNQTCRNAMADFAVVVSIFAMSALGNAFQYIPVEKLNVPSQFEPTYQCCDASCQTNWPNECEDQLEPYKSRPWLVNYGNLNGKSHAPFVAAGLAILAFILVFLDNGITWHLVNHPTHKLSHGDAYNYDTALTGVFILINTMLGLPWVCASTTPCLNHLHAMAEKNSKGEFLSIHETRLTGLFLHLVMAVTLSALNLLKLIPMPVFYGVFFFMGVVSLGANQFWGRILMLFMQPSKYPMQPYTKYMKAKRMNLYTFIQLLLFALLYTVMSINQIAIIFPTLILLFIPCRIYVLPRIFTEDELVMIDSDEGTVKLWIAKNEQSKRNAMENRGSVGGGNVVFIEDSTGVGPQLMPHLVGSPSIVSLKSMAPDQGDNSNHNQSSYSANVSTTERTGMDLDA